MHLKENYAQGSIKVVGFPSDNQKRIKKEIK